MGEKSIIYEGFAGWISMENEAIEIDPTKDSNGNSYCRTYIPSDVHKFVFQEVKELDANFRITITVERLKNI